MVSLNALCPMSMSRATLFYHASRGFSLAWLRGSSDANSHARGEPLLAGLLSLRCLPVSFLVNTSKRSFNSSRINF